MKKTLLIIFAAVLITACNKEPYRMGSLAVSAQTKGGTSGYSIEYSFNGRKYIKDVVKAGGASASIKIEYRVGDKYSITAFSSISGVTFSLAAIDDNGAILSTIKQDDKAELKGKWTQ